MRFFALRHPHLDSYRSPMANGDGWPHQPEDSRRPCPGIRKPAQPPTRTEGEPKNGAIRQAFAISTLV